jgi:hypothetical protein
VLASTICEISWPMRPVAPTTATVVVIPPAYRRVPGRRWSAATADG